MESLREVRSGSKPCSSHLVLQHAAKKVQKFALDLWDNETICLTIFKKILYYQGYWPTLETNTIPGYWIRYVNSRGLIFWTLYLAFVSCPLAAYFPKGDELIDILEPIALIFLALLVASFAGSFLVFSDRFQNLITALEETLKRGRLHEEQPKRILKQTKILSLLTVVYLGECMFNTVVFTIGLIPQLIEQRMFYARTWYPYDSAASPFFEITLVIWAASMMSGSCIIALTNSFFMANLIQAIGQFKLLNHNLKAMHVPKKEQMDENREKFKRNTYNTDIDNQFQTICEFTEHKQYLPVLKVVPKAGQHKDYRQLVRGRVMKQKPRSKRKEKKFDEFFQSTDVKMKIMIERCARHHQAILSYVSCINSAFNLILIQQYSCSVFPSLIAIILVTQSSEINLKVLLISALGVICNLTLGFYCFLACKISEESELVRDSIFSSDWLTASDDFKRSMRVMISRSNQPAVIRVGGFITVSRESYWSVLKLIYTYYMAARATIKRISH